MQPVIIVACDFCHRRGHYTFACPDNPKNTATPEQQDEAFLILQQAMRPASPWWLALAMAVAVTATALLAL